MRKGEGEDCQNANALKKKEKKKIIMTMMSLDVVEMISFLIIVWFAISTSHLVL